MFFSYFLCLYFAITPIYTLPASNEVRKSQFSTQHNDDINFWLRKSVKDQFITPGLPILQRLDKYMNINDKIKRKGSNLKDILKTYNESTKVDKVTEKPKVKNKMSAEKTTLANGIYFDNDLEPEFEWDYLDQLQQDLIDDYAFKDSRKKRYSDFNPNDTLKYNENLKFDLAPVKLKDIHPVYRRKRKPTKVSDIDNTENPLKDFFKNTQFNANIKKIDHKHKQSIDGKEFFDYNKLEKHLVHNNDDNRFPRDPRNTVKPKLNKINEKTNSKPTTVKEYITSNLYDPEEHNVEITLINFGDKSTEYVTEFKPIHFDNKDNNEDFSVPGVQKDLSTDKSELDAMNKYLNSKSMHNDLLYSEGNKHDNDLYKNNDEVTKLLQEYAKKFTAKPKEEIGVPRNDMINPKIHKRQNFIETTAGDSFKSSTYSEADGKKQDRDCINRFVRKVKLLTTTENENKTNRKSKKNNNQKSEVTGRKRRKVKLIPLLKEKLMFLLKRKNVTSTDTEKTTTTPNFSLTDKLTEAMTPQASTEKIKKYKSKTTDYHFEGLINDNTTELGLETMSHLNDIFGNVTFSTEQTPKENATYKFDDVYSKANVHTPAEHETTVKDTTTKHSEEILYVEPTLFDDKVYYESSLKNSIPKIFKHKQSKTDFKIGKRHVVPEKFTAKDVAALEVIVDLMKTCPSFEGKNMSCGLGTSAKSNSEKKRVTNSIQVHIAVPCEANNDKRRSLQPMKVRKVFSAKMSSPVDLEYQVNSFEELPTTVGSRTVAFDNEQIPPGMYLLVDNGVLKGNFALKPVKNFFLPNIQRRDIVNVTDKISTTSITKNIGRVTLSKDMSSAFNQQLLELFKHMTNNATETQIVQTDLSNNDERNKRSDKNSKTNQVTKTSSTDRNVMTLGIETLLRTPDFVSANNSRNKRFSSESNHRNRSFSAYNRSNDDKPKGVIEKSHEESRPFLGPINWDKIKQHFGHDRVCSCKCKVNKTLCKACAASDAVIGELIFEFDNLAKFMKDHCTEIQTYFWMNPTGGQKLRDSVHRLDKSLHDYYKRVKGKCQGKTCKTFTTYIDKREQKHDNSPISEYFLNNLDHLATDVEKAAKYVTCYDKNFIDTGDSLVNTINSCVLRKTGGDFSTSTTIKNVYALDNINVNIICKPDTKSCNFENIPITESDPILDFDYDDKYDSKGKHKRKELFTHSKKSRLNKIFTYYYVDKTTESFDIKKREVQNQIDTPLNADAGGTFWNDYINRNAEAKIAEESKLDSTKVDVTLVQTKNKGNHTTVTTVSKNKAMQTTDSMPTNNVLELIRLLGDKKTDARRNITTHKPKMKKTKPKKIHSHKTSKENPHKAVNSTKTTSKMHSKTTTNVTTPTAKHLKALVKELSNIKEIIDSSIPTTNTPKKSINAFKKLKSATLDFLRDMEKGNFMIDENALKSSTIRMKNDLDKESTEAVFIDTDIMTNFTTAANPTIVIIQDYDDLRYGISDIKDEIDNNTPLHNLDGTHEQFKRLDVEKDTGTNRDDNNENNFNKNIDRVTEYYYADSVNYNFINKSNINELDDEIENEKYRSLLLSIIDFEREKLNDEWLKYVYTPEDISKQALEAYGLVDNKYDTNTYKSTSTLAGSVAGDYDIVEDLKSLELPNSHSATAKNESRLLDFVHKFDIKIVPNSKEPKVTAKTTETSIEETRNFTEKITKKPKTKTTKALPQKLTVVMSAVDVTHTKATSSEKYKDKSEELAKGRSAKKICDIEATYNNILKKYKSLAKKEFETYVKNISCAKYMKVPDYFLLRIPKKRQFKRSRNSAKWDWIRDRRSSKDRVFNHDDQEIYFKSHNDEDNFIKIPDEKQSIILEIAVTGDTYNANNIHNLVTEHFNSELNDNNKRNTIEHVDIDQDKNQSSNIKTQLFSNNLSDTTAAVDNIDISKLNNEPNERLKNTTSIVESTNVDASESDSNTFDIDVYGSSARMTILDAELDNDEYDDFETYVKGDHGIYKRMKRFKRNVAKVRNLEMVFTNLPPIKCYQARGFKKGKSPSLSVPTFRIIFTLVYETNSSYSYNDIDAIPSLAPIITTLCCPKLSSVTIKKPNLRDKKNSNTTLQTIADITIHPPRSINCSVECLRELTLGLVLLTASNVPVIMSTKVILIKDGVSHTLKPIKHHNYTLKVISRCPQGYRLLKQFKICESCPANTSAREGDNRCSVCPRGTVSVPASSKCHSIVKGSRRYDWWIRPQCRVWFALLCLVCGCGVCVSFALLVHLTSYICGNGGSVPGKAYAETPKRVYTARMVKTCEHRKPPSPSRVVLARFFKPSLTSSRATDSQETNQRRGFVKKKAPPLPPIDFN